MRRLCIPEEEIIKLYTEEKLPCAEIAKIFHVSPGTISYRLRQRGVIRSAHESLKLAYSTGRKKGVNLGKKGPDHPCWKGGKYYKGGRDGGYIKVYYPGHPRADSRGHVYEHILVWEEAHGKPLPRGWVIHHINGNKSDNRPRNLLALPKGKHHSKLLLLQVQQKVRELEIENRQLQRAFEDSQMIFYISEN